MKQIMGQDDICRANGARVLNLLRKRGGMTRRQLEAETGLSWGGVTNTVNRLMSAGYLTEKKKTSGGGSGRTPGVLDLPPDDNLSLGVDVNDTGLTACMVNLKNEVLGEFEAEADYSGTDALLACLTRFIGGILAGYGDKRIMAIGISMQGEVDGVNGVSVYLPQCPGWRNVPLKNVLEERFGLPVWIGHDPDCMLSMHLEDGRQENLILLRLDKSVGMAAVLRGEILHGSGLWEVAHMTVDPSGPLCRCGRSGCLEAYVAACGKAGNEGEAALRGLSGPLAAAAGNLIRLLRPERVILCGNLMKYQAVFFDDFCRKLTETGVDPVPRMVAVADAKAAMKGAALLALKRSVDHPDI